MVIMQDNIWAWILAVTTATTIDLTSDCIFMSKLEKKYLKI